MSDINNLSDDQLDDLFKSASEYAIPDFSDMAWSDMQKKLDENDRKRRFAGFWKTASLILFAGAIGLVVNNLLTEAGVNKNSSEINIQKKQSSEDSIKGNIVLEKAKEEDLLSSNSEIVLSKKEKVVNNDIKDFKKIVLLQKEVSLKNPETSISNLRKSLIGSNSPQNVKTNKSNDLIRDERLNSNSSNKPKTTTRQLNIIDPVTKKPEVLNSGSTESQNINSSELVSNNPILILEEDTLEVSFEDTKVAVLEENTTHAQDEPKEIFVEENVINNKPSKLKSRLSLIIGISPDYSKVKTSEMNKMGTNFQVLLSIPVSKRLNLKSGVIISNKRYNTQGADYAMPEKWLLSSNKLVSVGANCNLLDIPIIISYDLTQNSKNNFYGSLGLTSYKMMNETYSFNYENNADPNIIMSQWKGDSKFLPFGLLNVSLGYERRINNNLSIQIEPFLKSPLKQIGMGSVKLETYGVFINLKINTAK